MNHCTGPIRPAVPPATLRGKRSSLLLAALGPLLLMLPAGPVAATPITYGFFGEFVGGTLADRITQPYYDADPDSTYMPQLHGTFTLSMAALTDQLPDDPLRGYFVDTSLGNFLSFSLEGQPFSLQANLSFDTRVNGASTLSLYNESFQVSFLLHEANFPTDSAANLLSLSTENTASDLGFWALTAFGGGYAYTDKAAAVWSVPTALLLPNAANQLIPTAATTAVPEDLPLPAILPALLAVLVIGCRARRSVTAASG